MKWLSLALLSLLALPLIALGMLLAAWHALAYFARRGTFKGWDR